MLGISHHLPGANRFVLEVKGDSMQRDNICDGDYIICEHRNNINKNGIVSSANEAIQRPVPDFSKK